MIKLTIGEEKLCSIVSEWAKTQNMFEGYPVSKMIKKKSGVEFEISFVKHETTCSDPKDTCGDDEISTEPVKEA